MIFILKPHKANPCRILKLKLISSYPENFLAKNLNLKLILSFLSTKVQDSHKNANNKVHSTINIYRLSNSLFIVIQQVNTKSIA